MKKLKIVTFMAIIVTFFSQILTYTTVKAEGSKTTSAVSQRIHVDPNNFLEYFNLNGSASYDGTDVVTLTPDAKHISGNATLKTRIDMSQSFNLEGEINLGTKSQLQGGADGIGFGFHSQSSNSIGDTGGAMGIGNLPGAFGWKADTFFNNAQLNIGSDPNQFGPSSVGGVKSFGGFMYNDDSTGRVKTLTESIGALAIAEPEGNQFRPISISYDGSSKLMTVSYEGQTWTKDVSGWIASESLSFLISASTGGQTNLQQFKIKSFDYIPVGEILTKYLDKYNNLEIIPGELFTGELGDTETALKRLETQVLSSGYGYDSTIASNPIYYNELIDTGTYSKNQLLVNYYYTKGKIQIIKTDEDTGKTLAGAEFDVYDASNQIVDHVVVNTNGIGMSKILSDGTYTIKETKSPDGYELSTKDYQAVLNYGSTGNSIVELTITNKKAPEVISVNGTKTWMDENDKDKIRPILIKINLLANGNIVDSKEVTAETEWKYSFENLPKYSNLGDEIVYSVTEEKVDGYETTINGFDIINTHQVKPIDPIDPIDPVDPTDPTDPTKPIKPTKPTKPNTSSGIFPQTGEKNLDLIVGIGSTLIIVAGYAFLKRKQ